MERKKITMVGNSHIDPVWLWRDREGYQAARATYASALERMKEFPEFEYSASTSAFYIWLLENCPDLLEEIRARVKEGRWHLVGGWWVEPDCNIPCGESLVRQGLYGQRLLKEIFGRMAECGYNVDSFGHQSGIPTILCGQRLHGYVFMRPQPDQMNMPAPAFKWYAPDGKYVIADHTEGEYCAWTRTAIVENLEKTLASMERTGMNHLPVYYGVGNHGGGPTIENIKTIRELTLEHTELEIGNGNPVEFFDTVNADKLPAVHGEMENVFPGCFTVDAELKRLCREAETALMKAEIMSVMAECRDEMWQALTDGWKKLLFCQFHDILAGTARKEARDDAVVDLHCVLSVAREVIGNCMQRISNHLDLRGDGFPLIIVNPTDMPYEGLVETDIEWRNKFPMRLKDADGVEQMYDASVIRLTAPDVRKHFVFRGNIPAYGVAVYRLMPEAPVKPALPMNCPENVLENDYIRAKVDPCTGALISLFDKEQCKELLSAPIEIAVYEDLRDTWGAQGEIGALRGVYSAYKVYREENGALRTTITCRMLHDRSEALVRWSLGRYDHNLRISARVDSREKLAITVLRMPLACKYDNIIAEAAYCEQERMWDEDHEHNMQRYVDIVSEDGGILVVNRAKYGYRCHEGAFEMLLMRGSVHAFGAGETILDTREYDYADQGEDFFSVLICPHKALMTERMRVCAAQQMHMTPETLLAEQHIGDEPRRHMCMVNIKGLDACIVPVLKRGEDGGIVARIRNCSSVEQSGTITVCGRMSEIKLSPFEIATVRFGDDNVMMTDMLEFDDRN